MNRPILYLLGLTAATWLIVGLEIVADQPLQWP
jgi:hypothetical protein